MTLILRVRLIMLVCSVTAKNGASLLKDGSVFVIKTSRSLSSTLPSVLCSKSHDRSCYRKNVRRPGCQRVPFAYSACKSEDNNRDGSWRGATWPPIYCAVSVPGLFLPSLCPYTQVEAGKVFRQIPEASGLPVAFGYLSRRRSFLNWQPYTAI